MSKTRFTIEITTDMPLTPEQRRHAINAIAQKLKELEYGDEPRGNTIQSGFILEQSE